MLEAPAIAFWASFATLAVLAVFDARTRRIPNSIVAAYLALGFLVRASVGGEEVLEGVAGLAVAALVTVPLVQFGGLGAGDCKLLAAFGFWAGPAQAGCPRWSLTGMAGGLLALVYTVWKGALKRTLAGAFQLLYDPMAARERLHNPRDGVEPLSIPYAPAIAVGAMISFFGVRGLS